MVTMARVQCATPIASLSDFQVSKEPPVQQALSSASPTLAARPSLLGIWRLGEAIHRSQSAELCLAQPADAMGSPRWDYVIKRAVNAEQNLEGRRQIQRFVLAASAAIHPNLIVVLDASTDASPYVVMPRLEGETLAAILRGSDPVAIPVALWWIRQVAQALTALHSAGWVHQDLKPENLIIGSRGHVTLIDLGFAARVGESAGQIFRGTPDFAAPEAMAAEGSIHWARDIFSLGRVLWSSMTRVRVAEDRAAQDWASHDRAMEPIAELIERMVAPDPRERPTAEWVSRQLLRLEIESLGRHIGPLEPSRKAA